MPSQKDLRKAAKLYQEFREAPMRRGRSVNIDIPKVLTVIGYITAIEYDTTVKRKMIPYRHDFAPGSRPLMCIGDGKIFVVEGRYHFTAGGKLEGIVDIDGRGKEIDDGY